MLFTAPSNPSLGSKLEGKAMMVLRHACLSARLKVHVGKRRELGFSAQEWCREGF